MINPCFEHASDARQAAWVSEALSQGTDYRVSSFVPRGFEAYVAILHPAFHCWCTETNLAGHRSGNAESVAPEQMSKPIRWSEVLDSQAPVIYGSATRQIDGYPLGCPVQYRSLGADGWVLDVLQHGESDVAMVVQPGDSWCTGPTEGTLDQELAREVIDTICRVERPDSACWFAVWNGFGWLSKQDLRAPSIKTPHREWLLFRAPIECLEQPVEFKFDDQSMNMAWPDDRSWFLSTDIDAEVTYLGGSAELIQQLDESDIPDTQVVDIDDEILRFGDLLQPVIETPPNQELPAGFEGRKSEFRMDPEHLKRMREVREAFSHRGLRGLWRRWRLGLGKGRTSSSAVLYRTSDNDDK